PADARAVDVSVLHRRSGRAATRRSSPLRALWRHRDGRARRLDAGCAQEGFARRELIAGRREQGYLGPRRVGSGLLDRASKPMLLSRVADALYWISRYLERAEHTARLMDVRLDLGLDRRPSGGGWDFGRLFSAVRIVSPAELPASPAALIDTLVFDLDCPESVLACVTSARENARQVREEINSDMWEQLNALFLRLKQARTEGTWSTRPHFICRLAIEGAHLFAGVTYATMSHGEGWQYLEAG